MKDEISKGKLVDIFTGILIGTAVGDALGLPAEGMSRERIQRRWHGRWRHRFLFGYGMISDDTEHTLFVAQALLAYPNDGNAFQRCLAWKFRFWLVGVPAGIGLATLRAILKLWMGFPLNRSGVFSAGNGSAMRSAIIGGFFADDPGARRRFVSASTRITHTDPRAETAALAVAEAVAWTVEPQVPLDKWLEGLQLLGQDDDWQSICRKLIDAIASEKTVAEFSASLGLEHGVTGYAYHSVPVVLYAVLRHRESFRDALEASLNCGGDTDTIGAMVGAISGARRGRQVIPEEWISSLRDWPRSFSVLERVGRRLAEQKLTGQSAGPVEYFWPGLILRNLVFGITVLFHGLLRLLPPY